MYRTTAAHSQLEALLGEWDLLFEIRSFRLDLEGRGGWRPALAAALDVWSFLFEAPDADEVGAVAVKHWLRDEDGALVRGEAPNTAARFAAQSIGWYRFYEPSEIALPIELPDVECPFVRPVLGYVALRFDWSAWEDTVTSLLTALVKESMGRVFATPRNWKYDRAVVGRSPTAPPLPINIIVRSCTTQKRFSLLLEKHSFDDGDVLLSREDPTYVGYVIEAVKEALAKEGYSGELGAHGTCHNPFRYWSEEGRFYLFDANGAAPSQAELETFLGRRTFAIWVFDFEIVPELVGTVEVSAAWS